MSGTATQAESNAEWSLVVSQLPGNWQELAVETGALKGLRKDKSPENLLRTLLIHLGGGHSLRETAVRARKAGLASLSDVALLKRLRKSRSWLHALCVELCLDLGIALPAVESFQMRAFSTATVQEPGRTGSSWRIDFSVSLPSLICDFFQLTMTKRTSSHASIAPFPIRPGDCVLADRRFSTAECIEHVAKAGGYVTVRVNPRSLLFESVDGRPFDLLAAASSLRRAGPVRVWSTRLVVRPDLSVAGRICALRKTDEAIEIARERACRDAFEAGRELESQDLRFAPYVMVFTTCPSELFPAAEVLEWYRLRWQIASACKRFKSLAQLGHLPKCDDGSSKAWLYGKLLVALLEEKLVRHALTSSPWGYETTERVR